MFARLCSGTSLLLLLALIACTDPPAPAPPPDLSFKPEGLVTFFKADGQPVTRIAVEIAETDSARQRGLMERTGLPEKGGMLFLMDSLKIQSFWMYNTPLPLDIVFVDDSLRIVSIAARTQSFSQAPVVSEKPARYVVEVRSGFTERFGLAPGDRIAWRREAGLTATP